MSPFTKIIIAIVAIEHVFFLVLEMFLWKTPIGLKIFRMTAEVAKASAVLASNQGLYNGFLAAGLIWALLSGNASIAIFFLICVSIAGVFGTFTVSYRIFVIQALPALLGLFTLLVFK